MKRVRQIVFIAVFCLVGSAFFAPAKQVSAASKKVTKVSITNVVKSKRTMKKGTSFTFKTSITPTNATYKRLKWTSSKTSVATVSSSGKVTAKKNGKAVITATALDGSKKKASVTITVGTMVSKVTVKTKAGKKLSVGKGFSLATSVSPSKASNKGLVYSSSNKKIATVSSKGYVKAIAVPVGKTSATVTITVKSVDGSGKYAKYKVTVVKPSISTRAPASSIIVPTTVQKLIVGGTYQLAPVVTPAVGVTYKSSNTNVITVSAKGLVTAKGSGDAVVYVIAKDSTSSTAAVAFNVKTYAQIAINQNQFVAHMGSIYKAPSNSLPSYQVAGESGKFMGIECDVRETKDGEFVLIHDADISARTNGSGSVSSLTLAQIQAAAMNKGTNISAYPGLTIPTLKDYLYLCKAYGMKPVLHIKSVKNFANIVALLNEVGIKDQTIITGGLTYMQKFKAIDPTLNIYWLCYFTDANIETAAANGMHMNVDYTQYVTQARIEAAHARGIIVGAYTVNNIKSAKKLLNLGIDFVTTDLYDDIIF